MRCRVILRIVLLVVGACFVPTGQAAVIYNNLTPNNQIAVASRPSGTGVFEIEAGDDFLTTAASQATTATFVGLVVPGTGGTPSVSQVVVEIYRVFPLDSNTTRTPNVPTRANSPSDVAFDSRDSAAVGQLTFTTAMLSASFTALNTIQPGGIHPSPNQNTGGNGPITGVETQFGVTFTTPIDLPADHYFFVPQVSLTNGGQFYWLGASRPITGAGTTPFSPDLQSWTRDENLSPDWLRVGQDIVGGQPFPTFNQAFSLEGTVPEPGGLTTTVAVVALLGRRRRARAWAARKLVWWLPSP